ncbi:MAG: hypothetical protein ACREO4_06230 [Lysobacter sp.]
MSLQTRLTALVSVVGGDIKALFSRALPEGGGEGQVLAKASATNFDAAWIDPAGGGGGAMQIKQQVFTSSGTFTPPAGLIAAGGSVEVLLVGGGSGGGNNAGAGGNSYVRDPGDTQLLLAVGER